MGLAVQEKDRLLPNPFGELGCPISDSELRETAYELLIAACRSTGSKPLTYIPQSERNTERSSSSISATSSSGSASLQRSLTSAAASKMKKALGLKSKSKRGSEEDVGGVERRAGKKTAKTVGELIRIQMRVSGNTDSRVRRVLLRVASGQLGKRMESFVLPLELLQQSKSSDFQTEKEYESWRKRNLKMLELGLLHHPQVPLRRSDMAAQCLRKIIREPIETGQNSESMQDLRKAVMSLAFRTFDGSPSDTCHWADGVPFNLRLYQMLLESCFDVNDETSVIEEFDEVVELIKKTWSILGINQMLHNLCFSWVLFDRYVETGQMENDLLFAANNLLAEVESDAKEIKDPEYSKILSTTLSLMLGWAEKRLLTYHDIFSHDNVNLMQNVVSLGVTAAKILVEGVSHENRKRRKPVDVARDRVETYIRSSVRCAFAQKIEKVNLSKRSSKNQRDPIPFLSHLAQEVTELAINEKEIYGPILKRWHPLASGVAVATLHTCYGNELKQFVSSTNELTPDAVQVLITADKMEKRLVEIAVEDAVESDDGGKAIIREMAPYEAEAVIARLVKSWIQTRADRLKEWVDRNLQQEVWNVKANKERVAPSAIEVLRSIDETLEAFFLLPIPIQPALVADLLKGFDTCLQQYAVKAKFGCGTRSSYTPALPTLTRCSTGSKFFKKKDKTQMALRRKSQVGSTNGDESFGISQLCVRINTMQHIRSGVEFFQKKTITYMEKSGFSGVDDFAKGSEIKLDGSVAACSEAIQQLCKATAYKVVFHELSHVLWDGLYAGDISSSRVEFFLEELEHYLEIIATTVHDKVRTRVITELMKASFNGFLLVLLAGGPSRAFTLQDSTLIEHDFKLLCDLFWSNGDGLPAELVNKHSTNVKSILPLFRTDTGTLIEQFKNLLSGMYGSSAKSRLPMPPTTGNWSPTEANTVLRVLCHRNDDVAAKFLKKTYNLPTKL